MLRAAQQYASTGLRVLATAALPNASLDDFDEDHLAGGLVLVGLQVMLDPPRSAAAGAAVRACHSAGITVNMITGDHAATATAIAGQLGLLLGRRRQAAATRHIRPQPAHPAGCSS